MLGGWPKPRHPLKGVSHDFGACRFFTRSIPTAFADEKFSELGPRSSFRHSFFGAMKTTSLDLTTPIDFCNSNDERGTSLELMILEKKKPQFLPTSSRVTSPPGERTREDRAETNRFDPPHRRFGPLARICRRQCGDETRHSKWLGSLRVEKPSEGCCGKIRFQIDLAALWPFLELAQRTFPSSAILEHSPSSVGLPRAVLESRMNQTNRSEAWFPLAPREENALSPNQSAFHRPQTEPQVSLASFTLLQV